MAMDRKQIALAGIEPIQLRQLFSAYNRFRQPALYLPGNIPLRIEEKGLTQHDLWQMEHTSFPIDSHRIQLGLLATLDKRKAAQAIHKEDQQYIRQVEWEYTGSAHFGSRYLDDRMAMMRQKLPLGYTMERETYDFWRKDEQKKTWLLLLVMGLIFFITTIHFESFRQAFSLLILIPLSFIGIFLTFYWFDFSFDQGGYTSFILLSGLVVNSLILIISDYQRFCKRFPGRSKLECYVRAFQHKITPILLTILSTALGLIPFLLAGDKEVFWFALAVGTIGGLVFSLVVIFCFIPVFVVGKKGV